jgi:hypothetical protein
VVARLHLGQPIGPLTVLYADTTEPMESVEDVWLDSTGQRFHIVAHNQGGSKVGYFSLLLADWTDGVRPVASALFEDAFRGRFLRDGADGLYLLVGADDGTISPSIRAIQSTIEAARGPIDWIRGPSQVVPMPRSEGYAWPSAIYVEGASYQTTPIGRATFGFTGEADITDGEIWNVAF